VPPFTGVFGIIWGRVHWVTSKRDQYERSLLIPRKAFIVPELTSSVSWPDAMNSLALSVRAASRQPLNRSPAPDVNVNQVGRTKRRTSTA
jgi:hypothetical protein